MAKHQSKNILLAGNIRIYCEGIRLYVEQFDDISIAGIVSDASELVDAANIFLYLDGIREIGY